MSMGPVASQGVEIQAIRTFGGERTNIVYYSDVRISDRYRLGGVNDGWSVLHGPLDEEHGVGRDGASGRVGDLSIGSSFLQTLGRAIDSAVAWACTTPRADGSRPADDRMVPRDHRPACPRAAAAGLSRIEGAREPQAGPGRGLARRSGN